MVEEQRRRRNLAMSAEERERFLTDAHTCRVATVGPLGEPHVSPLWFVWGDDALWLYSLTRSLRWSHVRENPRVAAAIDDGELYAELRGVEIIGTAAPVGEQPRIGEPCTELKPVEERFAAKYLSGRAFQYDGRHAWLRVTPYKLVSWDFRKRT